MSNLGEGLLWGIFLLYGCAVCLGLATLKSGIERAGKLLIFARGALLAAAGFSTVALLLLEVAFLRNDFSIAVVSRYSSEALPFFYRLSAVWAGSAGSLFLWSVGVFVLFGIWLIRTKKTDVKFDTVALSLGAVVCLGFSALLVFVEKPFAAAAATADDGAGLNPLLQNFWMIVHPPLLFVGYSAFLIPFVIVIAFVFAGKVTDSYIYKQLRHWLLFGICFLGLGLATGARWSYVELGWGGYWAWDPVENASLLPWLVAIAALHSLVGVRIAEKFKLWTITLAPGPFVLCLVATFITRSGILASVHSFGQNVMFSALLAFVVCCFLLWLICIIRGVKTISVSPSRMSATALDKAEMLFWANIFLILTTVVIAAATFWPIASRVITSSGSGLVPTRLFYDRVISVAGILLALLAGLAALADLQKRSSFIPKLLGCCAAALICFGLVLRFHQRQLLLALACGICAFSFVAVSIKLLSGLRAGGRNGGNLAHLGLLILVVAAGFSSSERSAHVLLSKGDKIMLGEYAIVYDSFERKSSAGVTKAGPEIIVARAGVRKRLWPHNNLYSDGRRSGEVAVYTGLFNDVYVSFDAAAMDGRVAIEAKLKPLMLWLWFAALLIIAGSALAIIEGIIDSRTNGPVL